MFILKRLQQQKQKEHDQDVKQGSELNKTEFETIKQTLDNKLYSKPTIASLTPGTTQETAFKRPMSTNPAAYQKGKVLCETLARVTVNQNLYMKSCKNYRNTFYGSY